MRATPDLSTSQWRKSSYSNGAPGGDCVEVASGVTNLVPVRDSKTPLAPALAFTSDAWNAFLTTVKSEAVPNA
ncbi:DUF397 domain-containing protein [Streptomyces sp. NPDC059467]|uniref:DUF397 domain-containing protein n=1 Tax=Streptomyces sp. NPDC059467 TaxID=3346844 RepID=UPI0036C02C38